MSTLNVFIPLDGDDLRYCEIVDCEDAATWICHPQGYLSVEIALCEQHKREAAQEVRL